MRLVELLSVFTEDQCHVVDPISIECVECVDVSLDSRDVFDGCLFIAINGHDSDGRDYILNAIENGAIAIIYEMIDLTKEQSLALSESEVVCVGIANLRNYVSEIAGCFFGNPSQNLQIYGITGTNGKTSCAYILAQAFNQLNYRTAFMGTIGVGEPENLEKTTHTTLDAISMQRYLAGLLEEGFTHVCIEVSSHALDQGRVAAINFYAVLYTNLSQDHLDYHQTMESYAAAKKCLFTDFDSTLSIINVDDKFGRALVEESSAEFLVCYGHERNGADVSVESFEANSKGLLISFATETLEFDVQSQLVGLLNVPNINLVVATLLALGVDVEDIQAVLGQSHAAPGRMELYVQHGKPMVVVDYAHTPEALKLSIESCRVHCTGELWVVFGCGGDRDESKRPMMGKIAEQYADHVIVSNDNPRSEDPRLIISAITEGMTNPPLVIENRSTAIAYSIHNATSHDVILVAGKGHETGQIIGEKVVPYSDRSWVKECLEVAA